MVNYYYIDYFNFVIYFIILLIIYQHNILLVSVMTISDSISNENVVKAILL